MAENTEKFEYIYEFEGKNLKDGIEKSSKGLDHFIEMTGKGFDKVINGARTAIDWVVKFGDKAVLSPIKKLLTPILSMDVGLTSIGGKIKGLTQRFVKWGKETFQVRERLSGILTTLKTIAKLGGLGVLLGGFGILLKPLMTVVSIITDTLQPALDVVSRTLKAAFAPLAKELRDLALRMMPTILKLVKPLVNFLIRGVALIRDLMDEIDFGELFGLVEELVPMLDKIVKSFVRDFLKPVSGILFQTVIKLFKSLVKFAIEFVKTVAPYMPQFFSLLQRIAHLIITSLGDALDDLLKELVKQLPTVVPLITSMLELFEKLLPEILKLIPPLAKIAVILVKFLTVANVKLLEMLLKLMVKFLDVLVPVLDKFTLFVELLAWWLEQSGLIEDFGVVMDELGRLALEWFEDVKVAAEELVRLVGEWIEDLKEVLKFLGIIKDEQAEEAAASDAAFAKSSSDIAGIRKREEENVARAKASLIAAGRDPDFIRNWEGLQKARIEGLIAQATMRGATKRGDGGYVAQEELAVIGEKDPEWVVPDTPEGMAEFLPKMMRSALKQTGGVSARGGIVPRVLGAMSERTVEMLLTQIRDLLIRIEEGMESSVGLPEVLGG